MMIVKTRAVEADCESAEIQFMLELMLKGWSTDSTAVPATMN